MKILLAAVLSAMSVAAAGGTEMKIYKSTSGEVSDSYGVHIVPVKLSPGLEPQRKEIETAVLAAQRRVAKFAKVHGWEKLVKESFFDQVEVYDSREAYAAELAKIFGVKPGELLKDGIILSGTLEKRRLMSVSPEIYFDSYPAGRENNAYEKLLSHEIFHRLHIRILNGNEEAMGPVWFYEGFAIYSADQFAGSPVKMTDPEIWGMLADPARASYTKYGAIMRWLTSKIKIETMVNRASGKDFADWLKREVSGEK